MQGRLAVLPDSYSACVGYGRKKKICGFAWDTAELSNNAGIRVKACGKCSSKPGGELPPIQHMVRFGKIADQSVFVGGSHQGKHFQFFSALFPADAFIISVSSAS